MQNSIQVRRGKYWVPWLVSSNLLAISACIFFGFLYVNVIYSAFSPDHWLDLRVYEEVFNDPYYHYAQLNRTWVSWIKDEPLWYEAVLAARSATWTYTETINFISVISISIISYVIYRLVNNKLWPLILLINPSTIDLIIAQVRSALAFSIFLISFLNPPWIVRIILIVCAGTIHTSMYLFGSIYIFISLYQEYGKSISVLNYKLSIILCSLIIAFIVSIAAPLILGAIGDRRVIIETEVLGILFSLTWLSLAISYYLISKFDSFIFPHFFYSICVLIGLFSIFTGSYGSRYIAVAIPFLIIMIARQPVIQRNFLLSHYAIVMAAYYYFYLTQAGVL